MNASPNTGGRSASGGALASGGAPAAGGDLATGGAGGEVWDAPWLAAGAPGTFSEDQLLGSCSLEDAFGTITDCVEVYDLESQIGVSCEKGGFEPNLYSWSAYPCPRTAVLGICVHDDTFYVHYYFDDTVYSRSIVEDCESDDGEFYEP